MSQQSPLKKQQNSNHKNDKVKLAGFRKSQRNLEQQKQKSEQKEEINQKQDIKRRIKSEDKDLQEPQLLKKHQKIHNNHDIQQLQDLAHQLRIHSIEMTNASESGHPTSCCSMAELMAVLFFDQSGIHYNPKNPRSFSSDRFVLSKGHAAPILYAAWSVAGLIDTKELLNLRKFDSDLEGHPTPKLPFVDIATGSLGQGLSVAGGMAYSSKYLDKIDNHYWALIGDGESAEGSIWEACNLASHYSLNNLTLIVDVNRLGQSQETLLQHDVETYKLRMESFGFATFKIDGHNIYEIIEAFEKCRNTRDRPQCILAKTFKGKYIQDIENQSDWHGKPLAIRADSVINHLKQLQKQNQFTLIPRIPSIDTQYPELPQLHINNLNYEIGAKTSTRKAYGTALVNLSATDTNSQLISLDGDVKNSTFSLTYKQAHPDRFVECFIAEQNLVGWAQGIACRGKVAFASTFAAFFSRAYDQIRMGGISGSQVKFVGSHCGVSIGEDGPSQMALEDIAMFRAIPDCLVLYPSDAVSAERAVELAANYRGSAFIRTSRPDTDILYGNNEQFHIGESKILRHDYADEIVVIGAGVTLHQTLQAYNTLKGEGILISVIDLFSVKPFDKVGILNLVRQTKQRKVLTIEDHYLQGGIFETVASALSDQSDIQVYGVGVTSVPRSGKPNELLEYYGLDAKSIHKKIKSILGLQQLQ